MDTHEVIHLINGVEVERQVMDGSPETLGWTVRLALPNAVFETDNDGQYILYTGMNERDS
jgi:hypothetical protein